MKYRHKRKLILIVGSLLFFGIARFAPYPYKVALFCAAYIFILLYVGREIYQLATKKGNDIKFSKWELDAIDDLKYEEAIISYVLAIILTGCSVFLFWFCGIRNQNIADLVLGSIGGLGGLLAIMHANQIKYVLYIKKNFEIKKPDVTTGSTPDRE